MRLKLILPAFALLLVVSTATSFVGYRYLGLASDMRGRMFVHLDATHQLIEILQSAPVELRPGLIEQADGLLQLAYAQVLWCADLLNGLDGALFRRLGATGALAICERDVEIAREAINGFAQMADIHANGANDDLFPLGILVRNRAGAMREDSRAFQPYMAEIEKRLERVVRSGTALTAIGLALVFAMIARDLVRAAARQRKQTAELAELAAIAERANDSINITDVEGRITWVNPAFEHLTGYKLDEVIGKLPGDFLQGPESDPETVYEIRNAVTARRSIKRTVLNYNKSRVPYWVSLSISPLMSSTEGYQGYVAISSDISNEMAQREALEKANREIKHQALHDSLTGLRNRRALDEALRERARNNQPATIVRIDLDHFKYVNDTMGHEAGDFVLRQVAAIMVELCETDDIPARVGGDEFVVLLAADRTEETGSALAQSLLDRIREPMEFEAKLVRVGASFGVASTLGALVNIDSVVVAADAALYEAKEAGRNRVDLYTPELHEQIGARRDMARELKRAIAEEEFTPYFQPQIDARSRSLIGVETLVRWDSEALGFLMPDTFLPVAERLSVVAEIDDIVFRKAVAQIREIHEMGVGIDKLSVNVTAHRIHDPNVVRMVKELDSGGLTLSFEVLESVLVEEQTELFRFGVDALRDVGVKIEIDDFGSGHASIIGLMQLGPDAMKIDRRLVRDIGVSSVNREVVQNIVNIAKSMDLTVVAEGVETSEQADLLAEIGCHILQGYAIAKPMPIDALKAFATDYAKRFPPMPVEASKRG